MRFRRAARELVVARHPYLRVVDFGHVADGGMHFNLAWPDDAANRYDGDAVRVVRDQIYQFAVGDFGSSYSAEHGIGPHNVAWYRKFTAPAALGLSARLQGMLDPHRLCGVVDLGPSLETA